jgi:hypothetical protein
LDIYKKRKSIVKNSKIQKFKNSKIQKKKIIIIIINIYKYI